MSVFEVSLVRIFLYSDFIWRDLRISKYSVQMQENTDQKNSDSGHFYTQCCVFITLKRNLNFKKTSKLRTLSLKKSFPYITELWCVLILKLEIWLESRLTCRWTPPKNTLFNPKFPFLWLLDTGAKPHFFKTTWLIIKNQNTAVAEQKEEKKSVITIITIITIS